jgi:hypothetical protein
MGEWMYRSTFSWPRHYLEVSGQLHAPAALFPENIPSYPLDRRARWISEPVWTTWRRENSWPYWDSNSNPSLVQLVASRYTDYAIPAPYKQIKINKWINEYWQGMWRAWEKGDMHTNLPSETLESRVHANDAAVDGKETTSSVKKYSHALLTLRFEYLIW